MVLGLHRPDLVTLIAEGLAGIHPDPSVNEDRFAVQVQDAGTDVVVVVAFGVMAALGCKVEPFFGGVFPRRHHLDAGEPDVPLIRRGETALGHLLLGEKAGQHPAEGALLHPVAARGDARGETHQLLIPDAPAVTVDHAARNVDPGAAVGKIDEIVPVDVGAVEEPPDLPDQFLPEKVDLAA